jgi:hypothetical protein
VHTAALERARDACDHTYPWFIKNNGERACCGCTRTATEIGVRKQADTLVRPKFKDAVLTDEEYIECTCGRTVGMHWPDCALTVKLAKDNGLMGGEWIG